MQYDLLLTQNVSSGGVEFSEKYVNIAKGGLLSADGSGTPTVLAAGTDGYMLVRDAAEATGLKWIAISAGHTQGTDSGTTGNTFTIDSDSSTGKITIDVALNAGEDHTMTVTNAAMADDVTITLPATTGTVALTSQLHTQNTDTGTTGTTFTVDSDASTGKVQVKAVAGSADKTLILQNAQLTDDRTITFPDSSGTVALTSQLPSSPLTYKGVIDCSGNPNYQSATVGDVYFVSVAGKIGGASGVAVEAGDSVICNETNGGGNQATVGTKFNVIQKNIDGAVTGPASVSDGYLAVFDGVTGKIIKAGSSAPGTMAYETATSYVAKALFDAHTILAATSDDTPAALTVGEQTIVGRITGGNIAALTPAQAMSVLWVTAPTSKGDTGTAGQIAKDANWLYLCTAASTWKRVALATNWGAE